ncbi:CdaR family protein [Calderihabitans maritimus]|uniref:CdaR family protein n=1 Tax=Calderihabitans maritimus TaxID=1246530 RepID=UPI0018643E3C|nr:CdaR family protein [Calderihabitans maritimus]
MKKVLERNITYKIISVFLALLLWLYVTEEQHPNMDNVINVPLEVRGLASGLVIEDKPASVKVRVQGREELVANLTSRDLQAYVETSHMSAGEVVLPVQVSVPQGVQLVSITPRQVTISIDKISEVQLPVTLNISGGAASGYHLLEPVLKPSEVIVKGPRKLLEQIGGVFVEVRLDRPKQHYHKYLPVKVESQKGQYMSDWLTVVPSTVEVFIPVVADKPGKVVPIKAALQGEVAPEYRIERVVVDPETVKVYGSYEVLDKLDYIYTVPVDINGLNRDILQQVELVVPPEVTLDYNPKVKVIVHLEKRAEEQLSP